MDKRSYRSFNIRSVEGVDDFASMSEAVTRRYRRLRDEGAEMPDLVLIDGGVGQLNAAMAALDSLDLELPMAGLAKREEEIWLPGASESLRLDPSDPAHLVLRQARDEAHRFAITRHRKRRSKRTLATELINVPGIGPGRAKALLQKFGSVRGVQKATVEELQRASGRGSAGTSGSTCMPDGGNLMRSPESSSQPRACNRTRRTRITDEGAADHLSLSGPGCVAGLGNGPSPNLLTVRDAESDSHSRSVVLRDTACPPCFGPVDIAGRPSQLAIGLAIRSAALLFRDEPEPDEGAPRRRAAGRLVSNGLHPEPLLPHPR